MFMVDVLLIRSRTSSKIPKAVSSARGQIVAAAAVGAC